MKQTIFNYLLVLILSGLASWMWAKAFTTWVKAVKFLSASEASETIEEVK